MHDRCTSYIMHKSILVKFGALQMKCVESRDEKQREFYVSMHF